MKVLRVATLLLVGLALLGVSSTVSSAQQGNIFVTAIHSDLKGVFCSLAASTGANNTVWNFYVWGGTHPSLYGLTALGLQPFPSLAKDFVPPFTKEGDLWTVTVEILPGIQWSDGSEVTADDVVFTYNMFATRLPSGNTLSIELGGGWASPDFDLIDHVEAVDSHTVKFFLNDKPGLAQWEFGLLGWPIFQKAFWEDKFDQALATDDPVRTLAAIECPGEPSAGAFVTKQWQPGAFAEITANANYSFKGTVTRYFQDSSGNIVGVEETLPDGTVRTSGTTSGDGVSLALETTEGPFVDGVLYSLFGDQSSAALAVISGDVDYHFNPLGYGLATLNQLESTDGVRVVKNASNGVFYLSFNLRKSPFNYLAFRQAVQCVIDKEFVANQLLAGQVIPAYSPVPPGNAFWFRNLTEDEKAEACIGMSEAERIAAAAGYLSSAGFSWQQEPDTTGSKITLEKNESIEIAVRESAVFVVLEGSATFSWDGNEVNKSSTDRIPWIRVKGPTIVTITADPARIFVAQAGERVTGGSGLIDPEGNLLPQLELLHPNAAYDNNRNIFGLHIVDRLNKLGVPTRDVPAGFNNIVTLVFDEQDFDMWQLGWGLSAYPDYLEAFYHSRNTAPGGNSPQGGVCSDREDALTGCQQTYDELADQFIAEQDLQKAKDLAVQLQAQLAELLPYVPTHYVQQQDAYRVDRINWQGLEDKAVLDGLQGGAGFRALVKKTAQ